MERLIEGVCLVQIRDDSHCRRTELYYDRVAYNSMRATVSRQTEAARRRVRGLEIGMTMNDRGGREYQHGNRHEWRYRTGYTP
jgi:hypothetical protein